MRTAKRVDGSREWLVARWPLSSIRVIQRPRSRVPDARHVLDLAESIGALGLIEPLVVDQCGRLIAGFSRLEAIRLLRIDNPESRVNHWLKLLGRPKVRARVKDLERVRALSNHPTLADGTVTVSTLGLDLRDANQPLAIEIAENAQRREYTRQEIRDIAIRLRNAGFIERPGKPRRGERALKPTLAAILGKSKRSVERILSSSKRETRSGQGQEQRRVLVLSVDSELDDQIRRLAREQNQSLSALSRQLIQIGLDAFRETKTIERIARD